MGEGSRLILCLLSVSSQRVERVLGIGVRQSRQLYALFALRVANDRGRDRCAYGSVSTTVCKLTLVLATTLY